VKVLRAPSDFPVSPDAPGLHRRGARRSVADRCFGDPDAERRGRIVDGADDASDRGVLAGFAGTFASGELSGGGFGT